MAHRILGLWKVLTAVGESAVAAHSSHAAAAAIAISPCPVSSPAHSPAIPLLIHLAELFGCPSGSALSGQPQGLRVDLVQASGSWPFPEALYILVFRLPSLIQGPMFAPNSRLLHGGRERKEEGIGPVLTYNK